jgi:hypothetical protein
LGFGEGPDRRRRCKHIRDHTKRAVAEKAQRFELAETTGMVRSHCSIFSVTAVGVSREVTMAEMEQGEISVDEALSFIAEHPHVYLLARRVDGYPTGYAMMARVSRVAVLFSTYRSSAKVKNLLREGGGGILAMSKDPGNDQVLLAAGPVTIHDGGDQFEDQILASAIRPPDFHPAVPTAIIEHVSSRHESGKRCILRLTVTSAHFSARLR